jgi:hypothetical protein
VSLDGDNGTVFADQKLELGGVYTLIVQETNNKTVSKCNFYSTATLYVRLSENLILMHLVKLD